MATATKSKKKLTVNITPIGDKVIIQRDEVDDMTDSGLYLPEQGSTSSAPGSPVSPAPCASWAKGARLRSTRPRARPAGAA